MLREIKTILKKFDFFINLNNYYKKFTKKLPNTVKISLKERLEQIEKLKNKKIYYLDKKLTKLINKKKNIFFLTQQILQKEKNLLKRPIFL